MENWIEREADKIKNAEATEVENRRWQLHVAEQVKAHWRPVWDNIKAAILVDIETFNRKFTDPSRRIMIVDEAEDGLGLTVRREDKLVYVVQIRAFAAEGVRLTIIETNHATSARASRDERFTFGVGRDTGEVVALWAASSKTPAEVAEAVLRHLFRA